MLWRGRIYSPCVRALAVGHGINAGVWGTAAVPVVYRTDVTHSRFCPIRSTGRSSSFADRGRKPGRLDRSPRVLAVALLLGTGVVGLIATVAKNIAYAMRSEVDSLKGWRLWYRATWRPALYSAARPVRGRIRAVLSPPEGRAPADRAADQPWARTSLAEAGGPAADYRNVTEESLLERDVDVGRSRADLAHDCCGAHAPAARLKSTKAGRTIATSAFVGPVAWLDVRRAGLRACGGKALVRVSTHLRPTYSASWRARLGGALLLGAATGVALQQRSPEPSSEPHRRAGRLVAWRTAQDDGDRAARHRAGHDRVRHGRDVVERGASTARRPSLLRPVRPSRAFHLCS